jgi:hypothetical protein
MKLKEYLKSEKDSISGQVVTLIHDDAPKNKFSVFAGRLRMIEDVEAEMASIERDLESQG